MARNPVRTAQLKYSQHNRRRKLATLESFADRVGAKTALMVGVNPTHEGQNTNVIERGLAQRMDITIASGLLVDDATGRDDAGSDWDVFVCADGRSLPFEDDAFDLVIANAIIEHVGDRDDQHQFASELARVGKDWVITTPNRWFPVEAHYRVLFIHWREAWRQRQERFTRLLSKGEFRDVLPPGAVIAGSPISPTFMGSSRDLSAANES